MQNRYYMNNEIKTNIFGTAGELDTGTETCNLNEWRI